MNSANVSRPNRQPMNTGKKKDRNNMQTTAGQGKPSALAAGGSKNESKKEEKARETQTIEKNEVGNVAEVLGSVTTPDGETGNVAVSSDELPSAPGSSTSSTKPKAAKGPKAWAGMATDTKYELTDTQSGALLLLERALFIRRQTKTGYPTKEQFEAKLETEGVNKELDEKVAAMMKDRFATAPDEADKPYTFDEDIMRAFVVAHIK